MTPSFWKDKKVLITGHTGFKGSWLSLWMQELGSSVYGYALEPSTSPNLFSEAKISNGMESYLADILDEKKLNSFMEETQPDIIFHMAAQPLVRESYKNPKDTFNTNIMGTVNLFESIRKTCTPRAVINVTTDKCYENKEWLWGYKETDPMGGHDPYSSSKGCSELITNAYRSSYFFNTNTAVASARAGNVIGGGDWSNDRLVPDIIRAFVNKETLNIRYPDAVRPWQHVLEPLNGYISLAEALYKDGQDYAEAWNFGPTDKDVVSVKHIVKYMSEHFNGSVNWGDGSTKNPHESQLLKLDISKATARLDWMPKKNLTLSLNDTALWNEKFLAGECARKLCVNELNEFNKL